MHPDKRREGRRIRKQRRKWERISKAFQAMNDRKMWAGVMKGMQGLAKAAEQIDQAALQSWVSFPQHPESLRDPE